MEEFSDLDDETGTSIVHLNNVEIARNIVEPIEYQIPEVSKAINKTHFNNLYSNLNNNIINFDNPVENKRFDNRYFSKKYINDFDRFVDENYSSNARIHEVPLNNIKNNHNNIGENNHIEFNRCNKENPKLNRLIEIQRNYNKITHKKDYFAENKLNIINENKENKPLNSPDNAFSSNNYKN